MILSVSELKSWEDFEAFPKQMFKLQKLLSNPDFQEDSLMPQRETNKWRKLAII